MKLHYVKSVRMSEFFWSVFSDIWTEYGDLQNRSMCSVQILANIYHKSSEYGYFLRSINAYVNNAYRKWSL